MKTKMYLLAITALCLFGKHIQAQTTPQKILIVYYSYSGNTDTIAKQIRKLVGGDIFEIQTEKSYPKEYQALVDQAKEEINRNHKPVLKNKVENINQYDTIFIGSPCWWATIAPPVASFLAGYDLSGKTIIPFMTHEGSRMGHSESDIKKLCPKSTVLEGLPIRGRQAETAEEEITKWLKKIGIKE